LENEEIEPERVASLLVRASTLAWGRIAMGEIFQVYPWLRILENRYLFPLERGDIRRLAISAPSQHGKSTVAANLFASRFLALNPNRHVTIVSYGDDRAQNIGSQCRDLLTEHGHLFGVEVDKSNRSKVHWFLKGCRGSMRSVGWGSPLTGFPSDLLVIDDICKSMDEALSPTFQAKWMQFWQAVASQRLSKDARVLIIGTRWCPDDLIGQILREKRTYGPPWVEAIFKAIAVEDELDHNGQVWRKEGEPLCADLHPIEQLLEAKHTIPRFIWETMYQGNPVTPDGNLWDASLFADTEDRVVWCDELPSDLLYSVVAVDHALGRDMKNSDYSAIVALAVSKSSDRLFVKASLERTGPDQTIERLIQFVRELPSEPDMIGSDANQFQSFIVNIAADRLKDAGVYTPIVPIEDEMRVNKENRIMELDGSVRHRDFMFVRDKGTEILVSQLKQFPHGRHDDGPDALHMACKMMRMIAE
jgi:predicted phage terminase large subunit-like protein